MELSIVRTLSALFQQYPLMMKSDGWIEKGKESDHISAFWDVLPTFADIAGVKAPEGIDGISFSGALLGRRQREHKYLYWEFHEGAASKQAIRMGDFKAMRLGPSRAIELYDLSKDIGEDNNIAGEHPQIVAKVERILADVRTDEQRWPLRGKGR